MPQATLGREASDGTVLAILSTSGDSAVHQLRAGEALSAVLLRATQIGLATDPISQPLEVARTRAELRSHVARRTVGATTPAPPRVGLRATGLPDAPHAPTPAVPASCRPAPADATVGGRRAGAALADVREGGQLLATRTDYLPAGQAEAQRALQDHVTPFPVGEARAVVQADWVGTSASCTALSTTCRWLPPRCPGCTVHIGATVRPWP